MKIVLNNLFLESMENNLYLWVGTYMNPRSGISIPRIRALNTSVAFSGSTNPRSSCLPFNIQLVLVYIPMADYIYIVAPSHCF